MRPWQAASWRALFVIFSFLLVVAPLGCDGDDTSQSSAAGGSGSGAGSTSSGTVNPPVNMEKLVVHYYRPLADYAGWTLGATGDTPASDALKNPPLDAFGARFEVPLKDGSQKVNLTLQSGQTKEPNGEIAVDLQKDGKEVWIYSESPHIYTAAPAIPAAGTAIVYYRRGDSDYQGYGLYPFNDTTDMPAFDKPLAATGVDQFGAYFTVHLKTDAKSVGLIVHKNGNKDPGPDQILELDKKGRRIWILSGDINLYTYPAELAKVPVIDAVRAHWVSADTIAWNLTGDDATLGGNTYQLHYDPAGAIKANNDKLEGGKTLSLTYDKAGLSDPIKAKFPHLAAYKALKISAADLGLVPEILKGQILVSTSKSSGTFIGSTGLQIPGVLDDLYTDGGALGVLWNGGIPTLKLWAPTARSVKVHLFDDPTTPTASNAVDMVATAKGVWSADVEAAWKDKFYLYEVEVFVHSTGKIEHNMVTDPYSVGLSANSKRSQILDLADPTLAPPGWLTVAKPPLAAPSDITLYELHVRDFSINDTTVPVNHRGTFAAFTDTTSNGMKHLAGLAATGLSHVHILPSFDFATVEEIKAQQKSPGDLTGYAPDGTEQQAAVALVSDTDGFNWGYDPLHYTVPEGSYATDPDGSSRIVEFRQMVKSLNDSGLRMVMDVVYNHTSAGGQDSKSVLDRVVPGYYHRRNAKGDVETSTCCQNTATEHAMMEKLMIDSLVTWARAYKVDGFRFDLMGHHMKSNIVKVRAALDALTVANDGVDGKAIYLYGEGWDYGEVGGGQRGVNATQPNMAGTGVGTFNDRLRDGVRGGGPFDSGVNLQKQGFINGLFYEPNAFEQGTPAAEQKDRLLLAMDQIRVGLTGNLKDYSFVDRKGATVTGAGVDYNGQPVGYTASPVEGITYAEAHDGHTLFDIIQSKAAASTDVATRVRMQNLAVDLVALGQGIPFFHAGVELLRSKSMDKNSFDSGDWFNTLDFTYTSNNWGVGLPPAKDNMGDWSLIKVLLADPARKPTPADIAAAHSHFKTMLQIRKSSKLFRLGTADDVTKRVRFLNTGTAQIPGLIVMSISDKVAALPDLDPSTDGVVVFFNATNKPVSFGDPVLATTTLTLHPIQLALVGDPVLGALANGGMCSIPARTTAVFVGTGTFP
jgi:pullulanase